ncbi:MAG: hypothetical protein M3162_04990 [Thermoproteota archaeon]|nr:hypothetical protein [Thermoproteota archaeon]
MNKRKRINYLIVSSIVAITIFVLFFTNYPFAKTESNNYENYFGDTVEKARNLTLSYDHRFNLWQIGNYSNNDMVEITDAFLPKFLDQLKTFNATEAPQNYQKAKDLFTNSLLNEVKSVQYMKEYLLKNDSSKKVLSDNYLSESFKFESLAFQSFRNASNGQQ